MNDLPHRFAAIVLAADREPDNEVARMAGVRCKALAPVDGIPMIFRVLDALGSSGCVGERFLCGPPGTVMAQEPELRAFVAAGGVRWFENQATPSSSAYHILQQLPEDAPVLLTTSDHALLSPRIVEAFCFRALASGCDVVAAVARHEEVTEAYPETHRTSYRFKDGAYCSCNLFAFLTPRAREAALFWRQVEDQRKNPLRIVRAFGLKAVILYLSGRVTLAGAMERASNSLGFKAGAVVLPFPEAAIDVDSARDLEFVRRIAGGTSGG
ncbi:MAG: MobA-like NTP transferase domain protein [Syntrophus sp. PtaU1.Bin208]|nr:MAG: MobA-like NTP transferase domain protein [Syntrophus sp. PtaU1.Bin208]